MMRIGKAMVLLAAAVVLSACSGNYASKEEYRRGGPANRYDPNQEGLFGKDGLTLTKISSGKLFGGGDKKSGTATPINRYLWQASLDTVSFMPLSSTDPFTGVIATDWSSTKEAPGERLKVTVYISSPDLKATSLKVAVYRQVRDKDGNWIQSTVDPATPRKLEDAILTRARQLRVAELEARDKG